MVAGGGELGRGDDDHQPLGREDRDVLGMVPTQILTRLHFFSRR